MSGCRDIVCLCWGLTSQSTIFQSCRDGATASWVINQYFRGVKCLAHGHNRAAVGFESPTSRSGVRHSTTEPPRSPCRDELLENLNIKLCRSVTGTRARTRTRTRTRTTGKTAITLLVFRTGELKTACRTDDYLTCLDQKKLVSEDRFKFHCLSSATATLQILVKWMKMLLERIFRYLMNDEELLYHISVVRIGLYWSTHFDSFSL